MKGRISPLMREILRDSEAKNKLMKILLREADSNILEFKGTRYMIDDASGNLSYYYKDKKP